MTRVDEEVGWYYYWYTIYTVGNQLKRVLYSFLLFGEQITRVDEEVTVYVAPPRRYYVFGGVCSLAAQGLIRVRARPHPLECGLLVLLLVQQVLSWRCYIFGGVCSLAAHGLIRVRAGLHPLYVLLVLLVHYMHCWL